MGLRASASSAQRPAPEVHTCAEPGSCSPLPMCSLCVQTGCYSSLKTGWLHFVLLPWGYRMTDAHPAMAEAGTAISTELAHLNFLTSHCSWSKNPTHSLPEMAVSRCLSQHLTKSQSSLSSAQTKPTRVQPPKFPLRDTTGMPNPHDTCPMLSLDTGVTKQLKLLPTLTERANGLPGHTAHARHDIVLVTELHRLPVLRKKNM